MHVTRMDKKGCLTCAHWGLWSAFAKLNEPLQTAYKTKSPNANYLLELSSVVQARGQFSMMQLRCSS